MIRRINAEPAIILGSGRALLLQVAHPAVAQGVADHSDFREHPFRRLRGTFEALNAVVYGPEAVARAVGERVRRIHDHVVGAAYRANDTDNLLWVHATLHDSALGAYRRFVGPVSDADAAAYYDEMKCVAEVFGVPAGSLPGTPQQFRAYFTQMIERLQPGDVGRRLAADIIQPPLPVLVGAPLTPLIALHRLVAVGTTPRPVRERLGLTWNGRDQVALGSLERMSRLSCAATPRAVRRAPTAIAGGWLLGHTEWNGAVDA